ncbi:MAG: ABC transporter permease [Alphaproteobacteria bacterium]|nr:MAG: ABC transporter permease [Alphaproteobacteria bacterium]
MRAVLPKFSPLTERRLRAFRANRRGVWALYFFVILFGVSLFSDLIANDRPLLVRYDGALYVPLANAYPETTFGGDFATEADYKDPYLRDLIEQKGWMIWPLVPFRFDTIDKAMEVPAPAPPSFRHWLGTDDQHRDVLSRLLHGFRLSVLFGLTLSVLSSVIGVSAGAVQGYFGGWVDLIFQRLIEIWTSVPSLYVLIIFAAIFKPSITLLILILLQFSWVTLVGLVRAEFLKGRNLDYVTAARTLGQSSGGVIFKQLLPNALVATLTLLPFIVSGSVSTLAALDFLGFGLPASYPSLGEMLRQGKNHLEAPWLGLTSFLAIAVLLSLLVFIGEAVRDAFDPRRSR